MKNSKSISFHLKKNQASASIQLEEQFKRHFQTPQRASLSAVMQSDNTLELRLLFRTFSGTLEFNSFVLLHEASNQDYQLLHTLTKSNTLPVFFESTHTDIKRNYVANVSLNTRESIKASLGELRDYDDARNLKETLMGFPKGFIVPYTNQGIFHLLVKLSEHLFEKIYLSATESIRLTSHIENQFLVLSVMYADFSIGSIRFSKEQICENILEDFEVLLSSNHVTFILASESTKRTHYLHLTDSLKEDDVALVTRFLFTGVTSQHISS